MSEFDDIAETLARFASSIATLDEIAPHVIETLRWHLLDTLGCAIPAMNEPACRAARASARDIRVETHGASVIGEPCLTTPELAAFANCAMIRQLELNDTYSGRSGGHPSNMFAALLAVAEADRHSGADVLRGAYVGTEVYATLCDAASLRKRGWDPGPFVAIATATAVAAMAQLPAVQIAHAVALACASSVALGVARAGELSSWKGCAEAHAVMNGVALARLARHGMTGPPRPFRGTYGLMEQVTGPFEINPPGMLHGGRSAVERTMVKFFPCQSTAQAPVDLFLRIRDQVPVDAIDSVAVSCYDFLYEAIGGGRGDAAEKWDPHSRETADHSLPYLAAVALVDGEVTLASFRDERVQDPALRPLMRKITVVEDTASRGLHPQHCPVNVTVTLTDGTVIRAHCDHPRGHPANPATSEDIEARFHRLLSGVSVASETVLSMVLTLDDLERVDGLTGALRPAECLPARR